jgi:hypothetical protein
MTRIAASIPIAIRAMAMLVVEDMPERASSAEL